MPPLPLLSPAMLNSMRHTSESQVMRHTYTRTSRQPLVDDPETIDVDESQGIYGPIYVETVTGTALPCLYMEKSQAVLDPAGLITVNMPLLMVRWDDPIEPGDLVSNVRDSDANNTLLLEGPIRVDDVDHNPEANIYRVAKLRFAEPV